MRNRSETFGARLARLRREAEVTQRRLEDAAGLSPKTVCHYESGRRRPGLAHLQALARALRVTLDELAGP
jgi:transcriptional regulator with XRE-family HTH domain